MKMTSVICDSLVIPIWKVKAYKKFLDWSKNIEILAQNAVSHEFIQPSSDDSLEEITETERWAIKKAYKEGKLNNI